MGYSSSVLYPRPQHGVNSVHVWIRCPPFEHALLDEAFRLGCTSVTSGASTEAYANLVRNTIVGLYMLGATVVLYLII